ncbi:MAG TPA: 16S rRNA (guanine(527)-N(7))-methyltransferase RsmG [Ramlibacter sp.]|nr:16S rRNA (guanine(527)-N(7))-methyltransferase RsmG [Ramlibacter sp.]
MAQSEDGFRSSLASVQLTLSDAQVGQLLKFGELLQKWTRVYNLTALRAPDEIRTHHILDSAAAVAPLRRMTRAQPSHLLDVGSGGGLPGVVIAIACPEIRVDCVDAVAKKAAFIRQVAGTLRLPNLRGIHSRVEQLEGKYDVISSRAFASLPDFARLSSTALADEGVWMAMKGKFPAEEVADLPSDVEVFHVEQLEVPGLGAERCLLWLRRRPV